MATRVRATDITVENYMECCRLCLSQAEPSSLFDFADLSLSNDDIPVCDAVLRLTGIKITTEPYIPDRICELCVVQLDDFYEYIRTVRENDSRLRKLKAQREKCQEIDLEIINHSNDEHYVDELSDASLDNVTTELNIVFEKEPPDGEVSASDAVDFILQQVSKDASNKERKRRLPAISRRDHNCEVCGKRFIRKSNLMDHLRFHANVKVYACEVCGKSFVQSGNLKTHQRTHTLEKPYACHLCHKRYSQSSALKTHIKSHTNTKNHVCEICGKGFTNTSDLAKHKLTHSGVKHFKCIVCPNRYFTQKVHLRKHLSTNHNDDDTERLLEEGTLKLNSRK